MGTVRIRLLGEMHVETDHGWVRSTELPGRQGRLVLACLALNYFPVSRDQLAEVVWPDQLPKSWERDLSAIVSKIRTLLIGIGIDEPVANAFGCYQLKLGTDARLDLSDATEGVERAEAAWRAGDVTTAHADGAVAVEILRRPFFPGEDSEWIAGRRAEMKEWLCRSLLVTGDAFTSRGMFPEARRYARRLIDIEPYRESGYALLIRCLVASGDRAAALKTYSRARELLVEELGVPPGAVLEESYRLALSADLDDGGSARRGPLPTGTVALLFTDLVGSVALAERLGADADEALRKAHFGLLRDAIVAHRGQEVKNLGDGLMAVFASTGDAVDAAVKIQQSVAAHNDGSATPLVIRVGVHVGEPVIENEDYFGKSVAVARRLCDAANGHQVLASDVVRALSRAPELFVDRRDLLLKGMTDATTTWTVDWRSQEL